MRNLLFIESFVNATNNNEKEAVVKQQLSAATAAIQPDEPDMQRCNDATTLI